MNTHTNTRIQCDIFDLVCSKIKPGIKINRHQEKKTYERTKSNFSFTRCRDFSVHFEHSTAHAIEYDIPHAISLFNFVSNFVSHFFLLSLTLALLFPEFSFAFLLAFHSTIIHLFSSNGERQFHYNTVKMKTEACLRTAKAQKKVATVMAANAYTEPRQQPPQ